MAIKYNGKEIKAIEEKMNNPTAVVVCPRCGEKLQFNSYNSACEVKCKTENCLRGVLRGI